MFYAHTREGRAPADWQLLLDHLQRTASAAAEFGRDAGVADLARIAGLLHDLGKYSSEFQARLLGSAIKVDHSTAGAQALVRLFRGRQPDETLAMLLAYCIAGHHTGLLDIGDPSDLPGDGTLLARLKTDVCAFDAHQAELPLDARLAEGALSHELRAVIVLQRAGHDLRRRCRTLVDQHDHGRAAADVTRRSAEARRRRG